MKPELSTFFEIIFWIAVAAIAYTYAGYPLLLMILSKLRGKPVVRRQFEPPVTVIIAAYNEERDLAEKLENTLALDYPKDKLEILVTSDCSSDRTDDIVRSFAPRGVRLHRQTERLGKTAAQNAAVEKANGEVLLFSDATTHYRPDVLRLLIPSFADPSVGCVTGNVVYSHDHSSSVSHGTRSYWNYEFLLKKHESAITSLIGVCGCMYAVRKSAYVPLYNEACSDFLVATTMVRQGLRAVYEPEAVCVEEPNAKAHKELATRVRIIAQTLADLWRNRDVLNPFRKGFYAVQLLSHKVMRYLVPLFLIVVLITSAVLAFNSLFYAAIFVAQIGFYLAAVASALLIRFGINSRWLALPQYFVITNLACLIALFKLVRGERYVRWEPVRERAASV
ncbi:MAG TPA: glycosyltransferase family 2 protein [Pyrinomonadaceae bacterium]|nr:glycosyltransferase family 2 protein [Pyrinomonadaceae bacterium]